MSPLDALRNMNLNSAYAPKWQQPDYMPSVVVPQGDTRFDPLAGTGWDRWFDAAGARDPGGMKMDRTALTGLENATPFPHAKKPTGKYAAAAIQHANEIAPGTGY